MRRKFKKLLAVMLALVLIISLVNVDQFFVTAGSPTAQTEAQAADSSKTEKTSQTKSEDVKSASETQSEETDQSSVDAGDSDKTDTSSSDSETKEETDSQSKTDTETADGTEEQKSEDNSAKETEEETAASTETTEASTEITTENSTETTAEENADAETTKAEEQTTAETQQEETTEASKETKDSDTTEEEKTKETSEEREYLPQSQPDGVTVKAYARADAFPDGTTLVVSKLTGGALEKTENVLSDEVDYDGLIAYDISFHDSEGKEIEPEKGSVRVSMRLNSNLLPEEADTDTLEIQHLRETNSGTQIETVAKAESSSMEVTENKVSAEFEVDSFSEFVVTYANSGSTTLWNRMPNPSTQNNKETVNFYLNLHSQIANSDEGGSSGALAENFTPSVFTTRVNSHPSRAFAYTPEYIDGGFSAYIIIQGTSSGSAYTVDNNIRKLSSGYASFKLADFPTDEEVFNTIKSRWNSWDSSKRSISVDGQNININDLNTQNFEIRWYVFKYNLTDAWHVDGILVRKTGQLTVQKTFENVDSDVISSLESDFNINVSGNVNIGGKTQRHSYDLKLTDDVVEVTQNGSTYTYTWIVDVYNATYTIKESNAGVEYWSYSASYSTSPANGGGSSGTYPEQGVSINCITQASDEDETSQSVSLKNTYSKNPVSLVITKKVEGLETSDLVILEEKLQFVVIVDGEEQTIQLSEFDKLGNGAYRYTIPNCEPGESYSVTENNYSLVGYDLNIAPLSGQRSGKLALGTGAEASFTNIYTHKDVTLTVSKNVYGNMGEKDKLFNFTLSLLKDNDVYTETLTVKEGNSLIANTEGENKDKYLFSLKDGESIVITVPYGYTYEVEETEESGYETEVSVNDGEDTKTNTSSGTLDKDTSLVFNNTKNVNPPSGLAGGSDSWMILLGAAAILAVTFGGFYLRRRKNGIHD